jgi:hypothetical protein
MKKLAFFIFMTIAVFFNSGLYADYRNVLPETTEHVFLMNFSEAIEIIAYIGGDTKLSEETLNVFSSVLDDKKPTFIISDESPVNIMEYFSYPQILALPFKTPNNENAIRFLNAMSLEENSARQEGDLVVFESDIPSYGYWKGSYLILAQEKQALKDFISLPPILNKNPAVGNFIQASKDYMVSMYVDLSVFSEEIKRFDSAFDEFAGELNFIGDLESIQLFLNPKISLSDDTITLNDLKLSSRITFKSGKKFEKLLLKDTKQVSINQFIPEKQTFFVSVSYSPELVNLIIKTLDISPDDDMRGLFDVSLKNLTGKFSLVLYENPIEKFDTDPSILIVNEAKSASAAKDTLDTFVAYAQASGMSDLEKDTFYGTDVYCSYSKKLYMFVIDNCFIASSQIWIADNMINNHKNDNKINPSLISSRVKGYPIISGILSGELTPAINQAIKEANLNFSDISFSLYFDPQINNLILEIEAE